MAIVLKRFRKPHEKKPCPQNINPLIKRLFELAHEQRIALLDVEEKAGLGHATMVKWKNSRKPQLENFEAALNVLGYELKIVRKRDEGELAA
jgi:hypothetical protein